METERLIIRWMDPEDEEAFVNGTEDRELRVYYGLPADMDRDFAARIFQRFCGVRNSYSIISKDTGEMVGFILDVSPELPSETAGSLPHRGRTMTYATFPQFQRRGYMYEALQAVISYRLETEDYIHCGHYEDNVPSRELLRKLGFREYSQHRFGNRVVIDEVFLRSELRKE